MTTTKAGDHQGAQVIHLHRASRVAPHPWSAVMELLGTTQRVLDQEGWAAEGSPGGHGPHSLTDALAAAAYPFGQDQVDENATQLFIAAWEAIARTTWEKLGLTPWQFQTDASVEQHHVLALLWCTRLRLQVDGGPPH